MNSAQIEENITLEKALRRANLLAAASEVSQHLTRILNIDELLPKTVNIICDAYSFYYAGVFLIDDAGEFAVLRAGRGEPGRIMMENNHKLAVGGNSMIGACTALNEARISLDVDTEKVWYPNPVLPETRSEMALPLAVGDKVIGAVTVQSTAAAAFSDEDIASLQAMANQLAIALENARQRRELEEAHAELVRTKTFEAIATATGDAIHWIGNKAEPIPSSVERIRDDVTLLTYSVAQLLKDSEAPLAQLLVQEAEALATHNPNLPAASAQLTSRPLDKLAKRLSIDSITEDLDIIKEAGTLIMKVKEELIGPAREQAPRPTMVEDVLKDAVTTLGLTSLTMMSARDKLPLVLADPVQLNRVFVNVLKNAHEATATTAAPLLRLSLNSDEAGDTVIVKITDNGVGIPADDLDNIWITFHTTKGLKGHAGLGLPASRLILEHIGGHVSAESQPGQGTTITMTLPVYRTRSTDTKVEPARGKILLVDDDDSWRRFATTTLEDVGYKVTLSGAGYHFDQPEHYDLIVVDDILVDQDSLAVLHSLQDTAAIKKVLAVSSNPRVERTKERKLVGIYDLISKPYTPTSLVAAVQQALTSVRDA